MPTNLELPPMTTEEIIIETAAEMSEGERKQYGDFLDLLRNAPFVDRWAIATGNIVVRPDKKIIDIYSSFNNIKPDSDNLRNLYLMHGDLLSNLNKAHKPVVFWETNARAVSSEDALRSVISSKDDLAIVPSTLVVVQLGLARLQS